MFKLYIYLCCMLSICVSYPMEKTRLIKRTRPDNSLTLYNPNQSNSLKCLLDEPNFAALFTQPYMQKTYTDITKYPLYKNDAFLGHTQQLYEKSTLLHPLAQTNKALYKTFQPQLHNTQQEYIKSITTELRDYINTKKISNFLSNTEVTDQELLRNFLRRGNKTAPHTLHHIPMAAAIIKNNPDAYIPEFNKLIPQLAELMHDIEKPQQRPLLAFEFVI